MPGETESQPEDDQRQARREGQGNGDQARDDQNRSRDHPGRLDNTEHTFKVTNSPTTQATPTLLHQVGAAPRAALAVFCVPNRPPLAATPSRLRRAR